MTEVNKEKKKQNEEVSEDKVEHKNLKTCSFGRNPDLI